MRLHLGCGDMILKDYTNCDLYNEAADIKCDAKKLPFDSNTADEILAIHLIEHFDFYEAFDVLKEWYRVLKVNGKLHIETPNLLNSCKKFINATESERIGMYSHFFSCPWISGQFHKFLYTETQLKWTLENCNYRNIEVVPALRYIGLEDINLGMEAYK
jgi:predicted SAM-dependent methyltransferase